MAQEGNQRETLLNIEGLNVKYITKDNTYHAINDLSFQVRKGEIFGLVGETGAGKTTTALSILRLLPEPAGVIEGGKIKFEGQDFVPLTQEQMREIRGKQISMIFQDPMTSLNPVLTVGEQIAEAIETHNKSFSHAHVEELVDQVLQKVGIAPSRKHEYPHQFSGGMKQRVVIAMALVCQPKLLIADEPTTALDVTVQNQVLDMMRGLKDDLGTSMILITHDLGIVCQMCDSVAIMYAGAIVEMGSIYDIFDKEARHHPYTEGLFGSLPSLQRNSRRLRPVLGLMPDPTDLPSGCAFHPRCEQCMDRCKTEIPPVYRKGGHAIQCHLLAEQPEYEEGSR